MVLFVPTGLSGEHAWKPDETAHLPRNNYPVSLSTASEPEFSNALFFSFSCTTILTGRPKLQQG
jgi:hypothetical protein